MIAPRNAAQAAAARQASGSQQDAVGQARRLRWWWSAAAVSILAGVTLAALGLYLSRTEGAARPVSTPAPQVWEPATACDEVRSEPGATLISRGHPTQVGNTGITATLLTKQDAGPPPWPVLLTTPSGARRELTVSPGDMIIWQGRASQMISGCAKAIVLRPSTVTGIPDPTAS